MKLIIQKVIAIFFITYSGILGATSLYVASEYSGLVEDKKAYKVGDSLTVLIVENSSAEASSDISSNRSFGIAASANTTDEVNTADLNASANMQNAGEVNRDGSLLARITVTVHDVLPTGELLVKGNQYISINDEEQIIALEGNVRPSDINNENMVLSTRIANANITYSGDGLTNGKPGVITRFFKWLF